MDKVVEIEIIEGIVRVIWCPSRQGELTVERCVSFIKSGREDCLQCSYRFKAQYSSLRIRERIKPGDRSLNRHYKRRKVFGGRPPPAITGRPREGPNDDPPLPDISGHQTEK